jgi:DNA-binding winged helix-turn-helix (wHTH) protein/Tol biopolymer transport system component
MPETIKDALPVSQNGTRTVRFGEFEADLQAGEVRKSGSRVKLQEQPFKILQILLERPGDLVTRDELRSRIWPHESYGDFDHAVNVAVGKLRTALGDSADNPSFIETVPRRGYRFVASLDADTATTDEVVQPAATDQPVRTGWSGRRAVIAMTVAAIAAVALLCVGLVVGRRTARPAAPDFQRLTMRHGTVYSARFAPGGHDVIYSGAWDGGPVEIAQTNVDFSGTRSLGLSDTAVLAVSSSGEMAVLQNVSGSSDGRRWRPRAKFMLTLEGTLGKVPLTGGSPRQLADNVDWADWSPDGTSLAVVRNMNGRQRLEFPLGHVLYETSGWISHIRVSPDATTIAFIDHQTDMDDRGSIAVVDMKGQKRDLSGGWESAEGLAWASGGKEIWFSAARSGLQRRIYAVDLKGDTKLRYSAPGGVTLEDIAPDGRVLLTRDEPRAGFMSKAPADTQEKNLSWLDWSLPSDVSADGKWVLFDEEGEQGGPNYTVAIRDTAGSPPVPLGEGMSGGFSPDGKWAASTVNYNQIVLLPTGAGTAKRVSRQGIEQYGHPVQWLADGKRLMFSGREPGHASRCYVQAIDGGKPRALTPEGYNYCKVSPDGRWVAARDLSDNPAQLFPVDGGEPQEIAGLLAHENLTWSSDPDIVYVSAWNGVPVKIYRLNINTGERQLFRELNPSDMTGICELSKILVSANGRGYVYGFTRLLSDLYLANGLP